ncbi:MAG: Fe-only nitrogenase subunit delta [Lachnospiraceae bacterium]
MSVSAVKESTVKEKGDVLVDYIMKKCLWQFHSRAWDRERQNAQILTRATQLLCGEEVEKETAEDKCYWADAKILTDAYRTRFEWVNQMETEEIKEVMQYVRERIDFLTITGSLNLELTDKNY